MIANRQMPAPRTNPKPAPPSCGTCRHGWRVPDRAEIECKRYPSTLAKHFEDWCGEFAKKESA